MNDTASELYEDLLEIYFDEYNDLSDAEKSKVDRKYDPINRTLDEYGYNKWYKEIQIIQQ